MINNKLTLNDISNSFYGLAIDAVVTVTNFEKMINDLKKKEEEKICTIAQ